MVTLLTETCIAWCRYLLGEGIEKKSTDLAAEVEEQTKKFQEAAAAKAAEPKAEEALPEPSAEAVAAMQVYPAQPGSSAHVLRLLIPCSLIHGHALQVLCPLLGL